MSLHGISIVIPAYNEEKFLPATLSSVNDAIRHFHLATGCLAEVIVVNNASTDRTHEVALEFGAKVILHEVRNIASVRNAGIRISDYELIVAIDADCSMPAESLTKIWKFMQDPNYTGAALGVSIIADKLATRVIANFIQTFVGLISGINGAMFVFRKAAAMEVGGFPEDKLIAEDSAFAIKMRRHSQSKGKKFGKLGAVKIEALDRKDAKLIELPGLILQATKALIGIRQNRKDLKFWYDPDR